jgi:hypothetical protein
MKKNLEKFPLNEISKFKQILKYKYIMKQIYEFINIQILKFNFNFLLLMPFYFYHKVLIIYKLCYNQMFYFKIVQTPPLLI